MFVALLPPEDVTAHLARRLEGTDVEIDGLRWTARQNWHVTLAFLAAVPSSRVESAVAELAEVASETDPFVLRLTGAGAFPRPARAGVVWAGTAGASAEDAKALASLTKRVRIALRRARLHPDRTPFRPHLTLARVRPTGDVTLLVEQLAHVPGPDPAPHWPVSDLHMVESRLGAGPDGTVLYTQVAMLPLGR
jgi:2'-5' RNA ligase